MTASNLGIIFGPTLIKPRQADAEVSLSSLVDYPYQALIVELLIRHYEMFFDTPLSPLPPSSPVAESSPLPIKSRFTPQEKEQQLSRHSKSLVDIKEVRLFVDVYDDNRWKYSFFNINKLINILYNLLSYWKVLKTSFDRFQTCPTLSLPGQDICFAGWTILIKLVRTG